MHCLASLEPPRTLGPTEIDENLKIQAANLKILRVQYLSLPGHIYKDVIMYILHEPTLWPPFLSTFSIMCKEIAAQAFNQFQTAVTFA